MTDSPRDQGAPAAHEQTSADGYNTGTEADRRKALDSVYDYNKVIITVATGTVALTATFLGKDLYRGTSLPLIIASWACLGVSILFGIIGMGAYISQYSESSIKPRRSAVEYLSLVQVLSLTAGLVLLGLFAVNNARSGSPQTTPTPASTVSTPPGGASGTSGSPRPSP